MKYLYENRGQRTPTIHTRLVNKSSVAVIAFWLSLRLPQHWQYFCETDEPRETYVSSHDYGPMVPFDGGAVISREQFKHIHYDTKRLNYLTVSDQ